MNNTIFWIISGCVILLAVYIYGRIKGRKAEKEKQKIMEEFLNQKKKEPVNAQMHSSMKTSERTNSIYGGKSYGPKIDPIIEEGTRALTAMGTLYLNIKDTSIKSKINEIMRITDKIMQDAIEDPSDIPQIKKFFRYYLPTTIKLLNAYDRMYKLGIEGENIDKSMKNINEMLDVAIDAYKKRLDSLFANQALDIETDIDVMNQMLAREGLSGEKDFEIQPQAEKNGSKVSAAATMKG